MKFDVVAFVASMFWVIAYLLVVLKYEHWLWTKGMDGFRRWLGNKLGYSIKVIHGFRSISWRVDSRAPRKTRFRLMIISNTFFLLSGFVPIIVLLIVVLLMFMYCSFVGGFSFCR
jgi:hypothetical protein